MSFLALQSITKARRRKTTQSYERLLRLSKTMGRAVQLDLFKGIRTFKNKIPKDALEKAYQTGSYGKILEVIPWKDFPPELDGYQEKMRDTLNTSAQWSLRALPAPMQKHLRFDAKNPTISRWLNTRTGELIVNIQQDTQKNVQRAVQRAFTNAHKPRDVADEIWAGIGLDPRRAEALANYKRGLQGKDIPADNQQRYALKYEDRLLQSRAMTIGRTEIRTATNQGQLSVWKQASDEGFINRSTAQKIWVVDGNPCLICEPMDGIPAPLDGFWTLPDKSIAEIPTDAHPNCYCGMELDFGDTDTDEI